MNDYDNPIQRRSLNVSNNNIAGENGFNAHKFAQQNVLPRDLGPQDVEREFDKQYAQRTDPWAGRQQGMKCRTCIWFVPKTPGGLANKPEAPIVGRCRRHAPGMGGYPVVYQTDWCGDHRVDENKV